MRGSRGKQLGGSHSRLRGSDSGVRKPRRRGGRSIKVPKGKKRIDTWRDGAQDLFAVMRDEGIVGVKGHPKEG